MKESPWARKTAGLFAIIILLGVCGTWPARGGKLTPERFFEGQMLALGRAIIKDDPAEIEATIRSGAAPNSFGKEGVTPLIFAYGVGKKKAMVTLLENGADPNLRITAPQATTTLRDRSAVTIIAGSRDNEYLQILLDHGGDINAKDSDKKPILIEMLFVVPKNYEGMKMLLDRGADFEATDSCGNTLLMNMALLSDFEHLYYMLKRGADFKKKDIGGSDISYDVFGYPVNKEKFPELYEWQRKCQEFLLAHGMKDPGLLKPRKKTPEEQAEWQRMYKEALDADIKRREK